ncbi:TetR/AcrR family transcriptional regulator [Micropruina sp.]|uniref:TetR/AcrR family transcriptional regulator n=1 Tax=Micropruina sp. TaxID=2737536 RepID=UPI0039E46E1F
MPKIVDPDQRRVAIAEAVFSTLDQGGLRNVTLANVADHAGLAIGSVRHFLGSREEMIAFAFSVVVERVGDRVSSRIDTALATLHSGTHDPDARLAATADILAEFLPLDAARRREAIVWIEFETAARTDARLAETSRRAATQTTGLIEAILCTAAGALPAGLDIAVETARLAALIDGLTVRSALHPDLLDPALAREALLAHLRGLQR